MVLKLKTAKRMRNSFDRILDRVSEVIHRVNAPFVAGAVVMQMVDAVDNRIPHIEVAGSKINLRAKRHRTVLEFTGLHACEEIEAFLNRTVTVRADSRRREIAPVFPHLFRCQLANIGVAVFDQLHSKFIHLREVFGSVVKPIFPVKAKPMNIIFDILNVFHVFLRGIGIIHTKIAQTAKFFSRAKVDADSFGMSDMQIAVRLRRKTGMYPHTCKASAIRDILFDKLMNKITAFLSSFLCPFDLVAHRADLLISAFPGRYAGGAGPRLFRESSESPLPRRG